MQPNEMTLRDQIALSAPDDIVTFSSLREGCEALGISYPEGDLDPNQVVVVGMKLTAAIKYHYADAMLAERQNRRG